MKNKTVENMELILLEIRKEAMNPYGNSKVVKTLIHSYQTMLNEFRNMGRQEYLNANISDDLIYQACQLDIVVDYIENNVLPKLLNDRDYVGINNYATALEKMKNIPKDVRRSSEDKPYKNPFKSESIIEELLNISIKSGTLVTFVDESHRGTGKTTALIKKAHELNAVLLVGNDSQGKYARSLAQEMGLLVSVGSCREVALPQNRDRLKECGYLVDEMVDKEIISKFKLKGYKLLGGFSRVVI